MARLFASSSRLRRASVSAAAGRSAMSARPVNSRCSRAIACASRTLPARPQNSAPAATFSSTVIFGNGCTI